MVPFVQFKKREIHPWRSVTFIKVAEPAFLIKVTLLHGCFSRFLNCINGTKSRNASHDSYSGNAEAKTKNKNSCFRKCRWREKYSPGRTQINFFKSIFRRYSFLFFSFFWFFCILVFFLLVCLFFELKIYILIQIRLWKIFYPVDFWKQDILFFGLTSGSHMTL